jgi:hypothetical protein
MSSPPGWAQWSIFVTAALLSPALAFLAVLAVAAVIGLLRDAGLLLPLAIVVGCTVAYWQVRRLRAARVAPTQF